MARKKVAQKIYFGGPIITMDDNRPQVEAIAVADGRILATGQKSYVLRTRGPQTELVDLQGHTLLPAFIDSHGHFMNAPQIVKWANVSGPPVGPITWIADFIPVLQEHVERLGLQEGRMDHRLRLRPLQPRRGPRTDPLRPRSLLSRQPGHADPQFQSWRGPQFRRASPQSAWMRTPPRRREVSLIVSKASNEPAGFIMETAFLPIFGSMPQPTEQEMFDTLDEAQQIYASAGVTTCQEGATHAKDLAFLRKGAAQGRFYLDIVSPAVHPRGAEPRARICPGLPWGAHGTAQRVRRSLRHLP